MAADDSVQAVTTMVCFSVSVLKHKLKAHLQPCLGDSCSCVEQMGFVSFLFSATCQPVVWSLQVDPDSRLSLKSGAESTVNFGDLEMKMGLMGQSANKTKQKMVFKN